MRNNALPEAEKYAKLHKRRRVWHKVVGCLACMVVFITTYMLILPAITMEKTAYCGQEEHTHSNACYETRLVCGKEETTETPHTHTDECYEEHKVLVCGKEESAGHVHDENCVQKDTVLVCTDESEEHEHTDECYQTTESYVCGKSEGEGAHTHTDDCYDTERVLICDKEESAVTPHTHTDSCYEKVMVCKKKEHTHQLSCYSNSSADVESASVWERSLSGVKLTGIWADDVISVAESQIGYKESKKNYIVTEDGKTEGYTRYGDWYGNAYGDWCAMFVSFCLNYADIPQSAIPYEASCQRWIKATSGSLYYSASDYTPQKGDLIFFDWDNDGHSDHVGLVASVSEDGSSLQTIEGNSSDAVRTLRYNTGDRNIMGYAALPENPAMAADAADENTGEAALDENAENDMAADMAGTYALMTLAEGEDETEDTGEDTIAVMSESTDKLPMTKLSGNDTEYNPQTDTFTTKVSIDFQFNTGTIKPTAGVGYTYTYPSGISVPDDIVAKGQQDLYDGGKLAGTYQFIKNADGTYSVRVIFNNDYIIQSGETVTGYVQFEGTFNKEDLNEKGDIVVGLGDAIVLVPGEDISYPKDETESYNIDVSKSGSWVQDGDKLVYTVYVRTTKGTPDPIAFTDTITVPEGITLGKPVVTIEKGTANYYYADWNKTWQPTDNNNWTEVTGIIPTYDNGKLELSLPKLSAEKAKDSNNSDCILGDVYKITYTYSITDQTVASVSPSNNVTVSAKDDTKGQTVTDTAETTVNVDKDFSYKIDKNGMVDSDKPGYIKWTITVNSNEVDIAGAKLTDDMLGHIEDVAEDFVVYPAEGANVAKDSNNKITGITFYEVGNGVNTNKYTITYYTPVEESWDGTTVTNKATLDPTPDNTGDEKEVTASVTVSGVQLNKWGAYNGTTNKIDWTISVNSGNLDIAGATLTDEMFATLAENDFTIEPTSGYSFTKDADGKITGITFIAVEDEKNTQSYRIKYSSEVTKNDDGSTSPVTNSATLSPGAGKEGKPVGSESTVKPDEVQLTKEGSFDWNSSINWTITVNASNLNIAGAELTDEMFSGLKVSDIKVKDENWQEVAVDSNQYTINTDENGKISSITFNAIGETGVNTNKYIITYSTEEFKQWEDHTVHNEANLTLDGKKIEASADIIVYGDGSVSKNAGNITVSEDGNTATIPWTVTLTIPKGGLTAGTTIVDDVTKNQWGGTNTNQWMTRSQITAWVTNLTWTDDNGNSVGGTNSYNPPPEQVTFLASNGNIYTYKQINEYNAPAGEGEVNFEELKYTLFTIYFPEGLVPPENATKLTFTYSTTIDLSTTVTGRNTFYNDVKVGEKEDSAEYNYYKPGVVKTDGNGNTTTTTVSNDGTLTWKIKATVGNGNKVLILTDHLPEAVQLESLHLTGLNNLNMELEINAENISGTDDTSQYSVSGTYKENTVALNIKPLTEGNVIQTGAEFTLTVTCKVIDAENRTENVILTNTAEMSVDGGDIGSSSQTQEWTYQKTTEETKVVDKSGSWDNTNRIMNYTVILNKDYEDLLEKSDTLTLIDTMTYNNTVWPDGAPQAYPINAALIQNSVKLYRAVWNEAQGKWVAGEVITDWSWTYEAKINEYNYNQDINTITATGIPDGIPLMFQYSYRITCSAPDEINGKKTSFDLSFNNTAKLEGTSYSGDHSSSNTKWEHSSDSAGVTTDKSYTFYKVEAGNYNVSLAGATFSVYKYNTEDNSFDESTPVKTYSTNDAGSFQITRQEKDTNGTVTFSYDTNTLYKVVETAPPEGYKLPDNIETYYFYFSNTEDTIHTLPENRPSDAVDLSNEAKTVYVENVKNTTEITVEKKWQDSAGNTVSHNNGSVTINLYQKTSQGSSSGGETGGESVTFIYNFYNGWYSGTSQYTKGTVVKFTLYNKWGATFNDSGPSIKVNGVAQVNNYIDDVNSSGRTFYYEITLNDNTELIGTHSWIKDDLTPNIEVISVPSVIPSTSTEESSVLEGTRYKTINLNKDNNWRHTFTNLPLTGTADDGSAVTYYYYIEEVSVPNYTSSYENNGGIQSGTITVTNQATDNPVYELPETGGPGTKLYTLGGMLLMACSGFLLMYNKKRRKEDMASS